MNIATATATATATDSSDDPSKRKMVHFQRSLLLL